MTLFDSREVTPEDRALAIDIAKAAARIAIRNQRLINAYAVKLIEEGTVRSVRVSEVGYIAAERNAKSFARKDVKRLLQALEVAGYQVTEITEATQ